MELQHIIYLLLAFLLIRFWWLTLKARERAEELAKTICQQKNVQLLDATVAFNKIKIKRVAPMEFQLIRYFKFEFSHSGAERRMGLIAMNKLKQEYIYLDLPEQPEIDIEPEQPDSMQ